MKNRHTQSFAFDSNGNGFNPRPSSTNAHQANGSTLKKSTNSPDKPFGKNLVKRYGNNANKTSSVEPKLASPAVDEELDIPKRIIQKQKPDELQNFTSDEVSTTGALFPNPEAMGFKSRKLSQPRPIPKYFLTQPKYLITPEFVQNDWDRKNQERMEQMEAANQGRDYQGLYEELQKLREVERREMEKLGLVDAENVAKSLDDAIAFQGSCMDMCPVFERVRRQLENNVKTLEKDPYTNKIAKSRAVKAFSRPAAGQPPPLPSEVRPPHVLVQTLDYLVEEVVDQLPDSHSFLWDRTRSIRQDFTYQNSFGPEAVDCNEKIVRIHLISLHVMASADVDYSQQQELEQFNKALQTLMEIYEDVRNNGGSCPNEAEFRAYHLLSHIRDPEVERQIQELPDHIYNDKNIQIALELRKLITQNNIVERGVKPLVGALNFYVDFFRKIYNDTTPLLIACLLETQFSEIRFYALKAMSRSFHSKSRGYSLSSLQDALGFYYAEDLLAFLKYYEIDTIEDNGQMSADLFNVEKLKSQYKLNSFQEKPRYPPVYSPQIDQKIKGRDYKHFINNGLPNATFDIRTDAKSKPASTSLSSAQAGGNRSLETTTFQALKQFPNNSFKPSEIKFSQPPQEEAHISQSHKPGPGPTLAKPAAPQFTFNAPSAKMQTLKPVPTPSNTFTLNSTPSISATSAAPNKIDFSSVKPVPDYSGRNLFQAKKVTFNPQPEINSLPAREEKQDKLPTPSPSMPALSEPLPSPKVTVNTPPAKKKLVDLDLFSKAAQEIASQILRQVVETETQTLLTKIFQNRQAQVQRSTIIKTFGKELFSAFLDEIISESLLNTKATSHHDRLAKKRAMKSMAANARKSLHAFRERKLRATELRGVTFARQEKRLASASVDSSFSEIESAHKRRKQSVADLNIGQRKKQMTELWTPLNLKKFVETCSRGVNLKIEEPNLKLTCLLVVEDWSSPYSKWLNSKFALQPNISAMVYENSVSSDKVDLQVTSLPRKDHLNKKMFQSCSFVIFEFGLVAKSSISIAEKLETDYKVLKSIVSWIEKYSYYRAHLVILFWDASRSGLRNEEVASKLKLSQFSNAKNVKDVILCNMSSNDTDTSANFGNILTQALDKIADDFDGELTAKGQKHKIKLLNQQAAATAISDNRATLKPEVDDLDKLNAKLMKRAQFLRKYKNLRPMGPPATKPTPNPNRTMDTTALANKTLASIMAQHANRSSAGTSSRGSTFFLDSSVSSIGNGSVLNAFGQGVVEESTPVGSPNTSLLNQSAGGTIRRKSDKIAKLRDLAANIKSRYQKPDSASGDAPSPKLNGPLF
ncbi:uncharacterized protein LODBEIA_P03670 [Lodderomyces beijingensis]|uniref:Nuclear mRNA export factor n=1 Tax=Lodderomyces beijingensis TaxID=1775926 RepID=A0ABP0ZDA2_9ASCO